MPKRMAIFQFECPEESILFNFYKEWSNKLLMFPKSCNLWFALSILLFVAYRIFFLELSCFGWPTPEWPEWVRHTQYKNQNCRRWFRWIMAKFKNHYFQFKKHNCSQMCIDFQWFIVGVYVETSLRNWLVYKLTSSPVSLQTNQLALNKLTG